MKQMNYRGTREPGTPSSFSPLGHITQHMNSMNSLFTPSVFVCLSVSVWPVCLCLCRDCDFVADYTVGSVW